MRKADSEATGHRSWSDRGVEDVLGVVLSPSPALLLPTYPGPAPARTGHPCRGTAGLPGAVAYRES